MISASKVRNLRFRAHVSQKNWRDIDREVECEVTCIMDDKEYVVRLMAECPATAIKKCKTNFNAYKWTERETEKF